MDNSLKTERVYTVLELNNAVRQVIKLQFSEYIWVSGEIQDLRASKDKRHIYFSIVQKHPELDKIVAKVNAAIFESRRGQIFKKLKEADSSFELKNDIEVKFLCELDLYPKTGNFNLIVVDIDPTYTLGKIAQSRRKIVEDLKKRGLLDKNKLKNIPLIPLKIGLITAYDSAAYHDFTNELTLSGYGFKILVYDCHMQGRLVAKDVIEALGFFNGLALAELDVIVITRGGGSTADLSYFDNKKIAESIAASKFAVISAIGHEINTTVTDIVSHTFCKTPTKAAQFLVERIRTFVENLDYLEEQIIKKSEDFIVDKKKELQSLTIKAESGISKYFRFHREELLEKKHAIISALKVALMQQEESLRRNFALLKPALAKIFKHYHDYLKYIEGKIKILDPENILKRGFSITFKKGKAIKSIDDIAKDDMIRTVLYEGSAVSKVEKVEGRE